MLRIRLARTGQKSQPHYRVVVAERRSKRDGQYIARLGYYTPKTNPAILRLDVNEYDDWVKKGAIPSDTVRYLRAKTSSSQEIQITKSPKNKNFSRKKDTQN